MLWSSLGVTGPAGAQSTTQPTRNTSEQQLDQWNQAFRQSSVYQNFMRANGLPTDGRVHLSDRQQESLERAMLQAGIRVPSGMHIDAGGNLNQQNHLVRNVAIGAGITAAALTGLGAAGIGPLSGIAGGGAAGAGAAGAGSAAGSAASGGALVPLTATTGATGVGALGSGAGSALGGSAIAGTTGAVSGLGSAVAGAAGGFPWSTLAQYAIPSVASVVQGYLGSNAANNAAEIQNQAAQRGIDLINSAIPAERANQAQIYGGARSDLSNLYNTTGRTQANVYNTTGQTQANLYNQTGQAQNQIYNQTAAAYQPYQSLGAGSLNNLSRMIGGGPIAAAPGFQPVAFQPTSFTPIEAPQFTSSAAGTGTSTGGGSSPTVTQNPTPTPTTTAPPAQNLIQQDMPPAGQTPPLATPQQAAQAATASSFSGPLSKMTGGTGLVTVAAPTGETMQMPMELAQQYVQRGARIVS